MNRSVWLVFAGLALYHGIADAQSGRAACERPLSFHSVDSRVLTADSAAEGSFQLPVMGPVSPAPLIHGELELRPAVIANQCARIVRPNRQIEEGIDRSGRSQAVHNDLSGNNPILLNNKS